YLYMSHQLPLRLSPLAGTIRIARAKFLATSRPYIFPCSFQGSSRSVGSFMSLRSLVLRFCAAIPAAIFGALGQEVRSSSKGPERMRQPSLATAHNSEGAEK